MGWGRDETRWEACRGQKAGSSQDKIIVTADYSITGQCQAALHKQRRGAGQPKTKPLPKWEQRGLARCAAKSRFGTARWR